MPDRERELLDAGMPDRLRELLEAPDDPDEPWGSNHVAAQLTGYRLDRDGTPRGERAKDADDVRLAIITHKGDAAITLSASQARLLAAHLVRCADACADQS